MEQERDMDALIEMMRGNLGEWVKLMDQCQAMIDQLKMHKRELSTSSLSLDDMYREALRDKEQKQMDEALAKFRKEKEERKDECKSQNESTNNEKN